MKQMGVYLCLVVLVFTIPIIAQMPPSPKSAGAEQEFTQLERDWLQAILKRDVAILDRLLADDFTFGEPDGTVTTKARLLDYLKSGEYSVASAENTAIVTRVYGDTAVVTGLCTEKSQFKGIDSSGQYQWTDTWIKRGGRWQCVAGHASKLSKPTSVTTVAEQELVQQELAWAAASVKRDVEALGRLLADDATFGTPEGTWQTKAQFLEGYRSGEFASTSELQDGVMARIYGDTAVVTGRTTMTAKSQGADVSGKYLWTDTWVKRDGHWLCVASHVSKVVQK